MRLRKLVLLVLPALLLLALAGCGSSGSSSSTSSAATSSASGAGAPSGGAAQSGAAQVLKLSADPGGALKYTQSTLSAKAGKITIEFTNDSSMQHDVAIQSGTSGPIIGQTPTFSGGTKSLTVTLKPGKYTYFCTVPGHRAAGMLGTLTVS